jgi:hypothetical protein
VDEAGRRHALLRGEEAVTKKAAGAAGSREWPPAFFVQTIHSAALE